MPIEYYAQIHGCVVSLKSKGSGTCVLRRLLVQPTFIELWNLITENDFDHNRWQRLTPIEKEFMIMLSHKLKINNLKLHSANNSESANNIERLKILEGEISAGNLNKEILIEAHKIIDDLAKKSMLHKRTANALKKRLAQAYETTEESVKTISNMKRRR